MNHSMQNQTEKTKRKSKDAGFDLKVDTVQNPIKGVSPSEKSYPVLSVKLKDAGEVNDHSAWLSESFEELISGAISLSSHNDGIIRKQISNQSDGNLDYSDVCECIPGYCSCHKHHYLFKMLAEKLNSKMERRSSENREFEKNDSNENFSYKSSCSCAHDNVFDGICLNPKLSRVEVVARPPESSVRISKQACKTSMYQRTILVVKAEAVRFKDVILRTVKKEGLDVIDERFIQLTPEQVSEIYTENYGSSYFAFFVQQMSSYPILVLSIGGFDSIEKWNEIIGESRKIPSSWFYQPSVRRRFGIHKAVHDAMILSDDLERAKFEIRYFFPISIIEPITVRSFEVLDYCEKLIHPTLLKALYKLVEYRPADPLIYLAEWILINNPFQPHFVKMKVALAPT